MKTETYTIGDIVKKTPWCTKRYPGWNVDEGKIVSLTMKMVSDEGMSGDDRFKFRERYTYQPSYPIFNMAIEYFDPLTQLKRQYQVTQFDFNKD